jgi:DNA-binding response OmpR family regulator
MRSPEHTSIGIVEDDPVMGGSLVQRLELEGYAPMWWQTGGDALAGLKRQRLDLLICDIRLPDMTGEDIFRQALSELGTFPCCSSPPMVTSNRRFDSCAAAPTTT